MRLEASDAASELICPGSDVGLGMGLHDGAHAMELGMGLGTYYRLLTRLSRSD